MPSQPISSASRDEGTELSAGHGALPIEASLLRTLLESCSVPIAALDDGYRYIAINRAYREEFSRIFGVRLELGDDVRDAMARVPEDQQRAAELVRRGLAGEEFTVESLFGDPALQRAVYQITVNALRDESGRQYGLMHLVQNVTERVEAVRALAELNENLEQQVRERTAALEAALDEVRDRERRMQAVIGHMAEGVIILDAEHQIISMNQAALDLYGVRDMEETKKHLTNVESVLEVCDLPGRVLPTEDWPSSRAARGEAVLGVELRVRRRDTGRQWIGQFSAVPIYDAQDQLILIVLTVLDITRRHESERALRAERELLQTIIDTIPVMITLYDPSTKVLKLNHEFERILGWTNTDLQHIDLMEKCYPDPAYRAAVREYMQSATPGWRDLELVTRGGQVVQASWANIRLSDDRRVGIGIDITERQRAEQALRDSEQRLRRAVEGTAAPLIMHADDGELIAVSEGLLRITGYRREELPTMEVWLRAAYGEDAPAIAGFIKTCYEQSTPLREVERTVRTRSGELRTWLFSAAPPEPLPDGRRCYLVIGADITQRKQAEEALRKSEAELRDRLGELRAIYASAPAGLCMTDAEHRYVSINERLAAINGLAADQHLGRRLPDLLPTALSNLVLPVLQQVLDSGQPVTDVELEAAAPAEPLLRKYWLVSCFPVRDPSGRVRGVNSVIHDITERKRAERALAESERRFRQLADAMPQIVWIAGGDGGYEYVNEKWEEFSGEGFEGAAGRQWQRRVHPNDRARVQQADQAFAQGEIYETEYRLRRKDGRYRWLLSRGLPIHDAGGRIIGWFGTCTDIHVTKQAMEQLRQSQRRLRELNETLEKRVVERTFKLQRRTEQLRLLTQQLTEAEQRERKKLAQMLHDGLQQMLIAIKMRIVMLTDQVVEGPWRADCAKLTSMVDQTVQVSRSLAIELSPPILYDSDLPEALEWLARWFEKNHEFRVHVEQVRTLPALPESAKLFLFHAVRELLFNAVKHSGEKAARVRLGAQDDVTLRVEVSDQGRGLDARQLEDDESVPEQFGLLSIRERLEALGGTLHVQSAPQKGATFTILLPILSERSDSERRAFAETLDAEAAAAKPAGQQRVVRVLVVDDHEIVREGLVMMLRQQPNFEVVGEAADGAEAVNLARQLEPDVVIMDASMPRVNGIEATRQIKQSHPQIEIIGLSLHQQEDMANAMREAGARAYLQKDGPSGTLFATIRQLCSP